MFLNIFKRVIQNQQYFINNTTKIQICKHTVQAFPTKIKQTEAEEIKDALDIEANLFENSSRVYKPSKKCGENVFKQYEGTTVKSIAKKKQKPAIIETKLIKDAELGLEFYRPQTHDTVLANLMTVVRSRRRYAQNSTIVIEGKRLIKEALSCNLQLETLLFSQKEELKKLNSELVETQTKFNTRIYKVPQHDLKMWSTLTTPPGLLAVFRRPKNQIKSPATALPLTVICDNIREPNNLGSIIRTCAALPCEQVITTRGCCDPWESKALRGGCGGHFRLPIHDGLIWNELPSFFNNEQYDSLNIFVAENNIDRLHENQLISMEYANVTPAHLGAKNLVIIGGESHGVSEEAYKFLQNFNEAQRKCLYIPLAEGVDSLNVVSALTLILYELRKHLINNCKNPFK